MWPSICILTFFSQEEIINLRRINRQALQLCKRAYAPKRVQLHRINLGTVKFFERAEELKMTKDSLAFFGQFKESFYLEILNHYKNVKRLTINLNFLFEEDKKNAFIERITGMHSRGEGGNPLKQAIRVFSLEDAVVSGRNIESLVKSQMLQNIQCLKLPRNSLGNKGAQTLFAEVGDRLKHIKKLDISSNNITGDDGGRIIADSKAFPNLYSLDLRVNRLGQEGFRCLIQSRNYPALTDLKMDKNKLEDTGAQQLVQICNMNSLEVLKMRSNEIEGKGVQYLSNSYAVRNL